MDVVIILVALIIICLVRLLPNILSFLRIVKFSTTLKGPGAWELKQNMRKGELLNWLLDLRKRYGPVYYIRLGLHLSVFLSDPEDIKCIIGSNKILYKSKTYQVLEPWLGKGILTSGGEEWHKKRKMLTPAFHFKMLEEFKQPMEDNCKILIEKLKEKADGEAFDIYPFLTLMALDIICETAMGIQINAQLESTSEYVTAVQTMCRLCHEQFFSTWRRIEFLYKFTNDYKERTQALSVLHGETERVIKLRKESRKSELVSRSDDNTDEIGIKKRQAFLDILLEAQAQDPALTDYDIRQEVDTFMFAGHDTTSSLLGFAIYLLSQNQAEQQKAYEETISAEGPGKYLEAVFKESLRIYPSVPFYSREIMEDVDVRGHVLPKGTSVGIITFAAHKDERYFPEPHRFKPERFLEEETKLHPYAFVAFSAGPRNCIGQKYAMQEFKCILSNLLRTYEILPVEGFVPVLLADLVMKSDNGIQVKLRKRLSLTH